MSHLSLFNPTTKQPSSSRQAKRTTISFSISFQQNTKKLALCCSSPSPRAQNHPFVFYLPYHYTTTKGPTPNSSSPCNQATPPTLSLTLSVLCKIPTANTHHKLNKPNLDSPSTTASHAISEPPPGRATAISASIPLPRCCRDVPA